MNHYKAMIVDSNDEVIASISASSLESLEEQMHKLKSFEDKLTMLDQIDDYGERVENDEPEIRKYGSGPTDDVNDRSEDYPLGGNLEPYDIANDR